MNNWRASDGHFSPARRSVRVGRSLTALSALLVPSRGRPSAARNDNARHSAGFYQFRGCQAATFDVTQLTVKHTCQCMSRKHCRDSGVTQSPALLYTLYDRTTRRMAIANWTCVSWVAYAPGTIAVNVTRIEREFNACQTPRSMYPSIFNRFWDIASYWSKIATFSHPTSV